MGWMSEVSLMLEDLDSVLGIAWQSVENGYGRKLGGFTVTVQPKDGILVYEMVRPDLLAATYTTNPDQVKRWADNLGLPVTAGE